MNMTIRQAIDRIKPNFDGINGIFGQD